ncbi:hypothetical protein JK628_08185 [Shewanella sp. KX20019]|uniref:hypothetical protein n=1 Tax=Shewanella sp. KX20019 TaxID=2803864 RepID=UPI0019270E15|nr:hypothetical protein [Shewanella sp. KX20019]QQX81798.1 hypothetical protein JK628_08185 [Shewanella sp. KX20019]
MITRIIFIFIININFILLIPKLSGIPVDFTKERLFLFFAIFILYVFGLKDIKKYQYVQSFFLINLVVFFYALINVYLYKSSSATYLEIFNLLFMIVIYGLIKEININELDFITKIQCFFLLLYATCFAYLKLYVGMSNGLFVNTIYYQISLIPFILLLSKRYMYISLFLLVFIGFNGLISGKRTVIILSLISIFFLIVKNLNLNLKLNLKNVLSFLLPIALIIPFFLTFDFSSTSSSRITNLDLADDARFHLLFSYINKAYYFNFFDTFFGHGIINSSKDILLTNQVHNDFFEIHYRLGLFGIVLYLTLLIAIYRAGILVINDGFNLSVFKFSFILFVMLSWSSMLLFIPSYYNVFVIFWFSIIFSHRNIRAVNV